MWRSVRTVDETMIAWRIDGRRDRGRTPLVLCNGIACDDGYWSALLPDLVAQRPVVRWHYRGHGRSGSPGEPGRVGVDAVLDDLDAVLNAAELSRAVLVGHSFGVQVALAAAGRTAQRVAGVVAVAGAAGHPLRFPAGAALPALGRLQTLEPRLVQELWHRVWGSEAVYWVARALRGTTAEAPRDVLRRYFHHVDELDLDTLRGMFQAMQAHDASAVLDGLSVPLLAVAGDADGLTPVRQMRQLALRAPDGELVVIHGASHTLPAERPAQVLADLRPFLDRIDQIERNSGKRP